MTLLNRIKGQGAEKSDPIPPSLWEAALSLTGSHSVYAVAKRLRLNYTNFKALAESRPVRTTPAFIELGRAKATTISK